MYGDNKGRRLNYGTYVGHIQRADHVGDGAIRLECIRGEQNSWYVKPNLHKRSTLMDLSFRIEGYVNTNGTPTLVKMWDEQSGRALDICIRMVFNS
jgi:hypothetical protein